MKTQKFTRKSFDVDAVRVTKENMSAVAKWCQGEIQTGNDGKKFIKVRVLRPLNEGQTKAFVGDWVLYAGTGYKVYTNKSFWTCFEKPQPKEGRRSRKGHPGGPTIADEVRRMEKLYDGALKELKKHSGPEPVWTDEDAKKAREALEARAEVANENINRGIAYLAPVVENEIPRLIEQFNRAVAREVNHNNQTRGRW